MTTTPLCVVTWPAGNRYWPLAGSICWPQTVRLKPNIRPNNCVARRRSTSQSLEARHHRGARDLHRQDFTEPIETPWDEGEPTTDQKVGGSNPSERAMLCRETSRTGVA
jgi:hypothetical protein